VPNQNKDGEPKEMFYLNRHGKEIGRRAPLRGHEKGESKTEGDCGNIDEFKYFYL